MSNPTLNTARVNSPHGMDPMGMARDLVRRFIDGIARRPAADNELRQVEQLLAFTLLDTEEFALAANRLENARRYLGSGEFGAAKYELRLLMSILRPRPVAEPRRINRAVRNV